MKQYIDKDALVAEIEKRIKVSQDYAKCNLTEKTRIGNHAQQLELNDILSFINTLEVKEVNLELENENNNPKITVGTKIRSKANPDLILSIISNDCHEDEFECSNGSVLSLNQIEKYYDIYIEEK